MKESWGWSCNYESRSPFSSRYLAVSLSWNLSCIILWWALNRVFNCCNIDLTFVLYEKVLFFLLCKIKRWFWWLCLVWNVAVFSCSSNIESCTWLRIACMNHLENLHSVPSTFEQLHYGPKLLQIEPISPLLSFNLLFHMLSVFLVD